VRHDKKQEPFSLAGWWSFINPGRTFDTGSAASGCPLSNLLASNVLCVPLYHRMYPVIVVVSPRRGILYGADTSVTSAPASSGSSSSRVLMHDGIFLESQKFLGKNCLLCRSLCCIVACDSLEFPPYWLVLRLATDQLAQIVTRAVASQPVSFPREVMNCSTGKKMIYQAAAFGT
jgi:hypothetical protein